MSSLASIHAEAAQRRLSQQSTQAVLITKYIDFDPNYKKRTEFRRLINPGILCCNSRGTAMKSMQILLQLSQNIIDHPDDAKFQRFKPTNNSMKTFLVKTKGALEYAIQMGFRPEVEDFQPYYVFNKRFMQDLHIGNVIIKEMMEKEEKRTRQEEQAIERELAEKQAMNANTMHKFMDDRKTVARRVSAQVQARRTRHP